MTSHVPRAMPERVVLATYNSRHEAEMLAELLESQGIECAIAADDCGAMQPMLQLSWGVRLLVHPADREKARRMLDALEEPVPEDGLSPPVPGDEDPDPDTTERGDS